MTKATSIAATSQSAFFALFDCGVDLMNRAQRIEYEIWCSGCLDATGEISAGSAISYQATPTMCWPSCSTVSR
jgi:hypothetical protein